MENPSPFVSEHVHAWICRFLASTGFDPNDSRLVLMAHGIYARAMIDCNQPLILQTTTASAEEPLPIMQLTLGGEVLIMRYDPEKNAYRATLEKSITI